ncbi:uncharacterized protein HMPREF1541_00111 [Cyphellophora europaea CBS 101466]|uniref:Glutamine amidotransferase domain-containing protein n=1 Tax=Cyphellophora europaea (strain CBS 101466) TaxID=1220924 RepID=W2SDG9_CYPE1|nr:uncharacterized protein HMPREF1541_00111 [Cyphellophora europaea CBS 101466]ETN45929.1 hypothetical protein HMPREF1541_00111 [Cyphellophora europaea CBS 101466]
MIACTTPFPRVAILRNYPLDVETEWGQQMLDSIAGLVRQSQPEAAIEYYAPIDGGDTPDAASFNLVILTGGTWDITLPEEQFDPWVARTVNWIRQTVRESPSTKLVGICWGHQVIARALGGTVVYGKAGTLIGVREIQLNHTGSKVFKGFNFLRLHKFHKRVVERAPPGFTDLANDHEIMRSDSDRILTFQGHPEMTAKIGRGIVGHGDPSYLPDPSPAGIEKLHRDLEKAEDGKQVWPVVMSWAFPATT